MLITFKTHKHIYDITNMIILLNVFFYIKLLLKLPNILTIQQRDREFLVVGFVSMLKLNVFEGSHYKRWRQRCILWLTSMHCYFATEPRVVGPHTPDEERAFKHADTMFKDAILSMLEDSIVDAYVPLQTGKEIWDVLKAKYGVSGVGSELYVMEQFS